MISARRTGRERLRCVLRRVREAISVEWRVY